MDAQVGVIGVGTMGSMALWQLAKRGIKAVGFEQFTIGHDRSAAGGESRAFRTAYLEGSEYVPLLKESQTLWRELEKDTKTNLLTLNGCLMIGKENNDSMQNILQSIHSFDINHEILTANEAIKRFPQHVIAEDEVVVNDKEGGFLRPELAVLAASRKAEELGSTIHRQTRVKEIIENEQGVTVRAGEKEYTFEQVIVTTGAWLDKLFPQFTSNFEVNRLLLSWFAAKNIQQFTPDKFPVFVHLTDEANIFGVPTLDGTMVKAAIASDRGDGLIADPNNVNKNVALEDLNVLMNGVSKYLPGLIPEPIRVSSYMDGYSSDQHPIVGHIPNKARIIALAGFSGHGFKMAPVMGKIAADFVIDGKSSLNVNRLTPERFINQ